MSFLERKDQEALSSQQISQLCNKKYLSLFTLEIRILHTDSLPCYKEVILHTSDVHKWPTTFWKMSKKRSSSRNTSTLNFWKRGEAPDHGSSSTRKPQTFSYCTSRSQRSSLIATLIHTAGMAIADNVVQDFTPSCWLLTLLFPLSDLVKRVAAQFVFCP